MVARLLEEVDCRESGVVICVLGARAMPVEILPVESRRDLKRFVKLPMRLYRNEPNWVTTAS